MHQWLLSGRSPQLYLRAYQCVRRQGGQTAAGTGPANNQILPCFVKGVAHGAIGAALVVGGTALAVGVGVVSAPVATAVLTGAAVIGGVALGVNSIYNYATGNTAGLAYNAGSLLGGAIVGGAGARTVFGQLSPGQTFSGLSWNSLTGELGQFYKPSLGPPNMNYWGTGPTAWHAAGAPAMAGSGTSVAAKGGC